MGNKFYTPAQAANVAHTSRSTISRELKSGKLRGIRNNSGHWRIAEDDLTAWLGQALHTVQDQPKTDQSAQIAHLTAKVGMLEERITDLKTDRDEWRRQAQRRWWDFLRAR